MAGRTVQVRIGGATYRVVTSASDEDLQRLAAIVDGKLATVVPPGRPVTPQAMLLAAMALAHDLEEERSRSVALAAKARGAVGRMIERVDAVLGAAPDTAPLPNPAAAAPTKPGTPTLRPVPREVAATPAAADRLVSAKPRAGEAGRPANES